MADAQRLAKSDSSDSNAMPRPGPCELVRNNDVVTHDGRLDTPSIERQIYLLWITATTAAMFVVALIILIFMPLDWWFFAIVGVGVFLGSIGGFMEVNETRNGG